MTNRIAIALALLILAGLVLDQVASSGAGAIFLARRFADLLEWVAFWRP